MAVHIFTVSEKNFQISIQRGLVAIPEPKESTRSGVVFDVLLSRLAVIREDDYILMYVIGSKELRGVWQADGRPFYDESPVWPDRVYPFRCKIKCTAYNFENALKLNDINDLRNVGEIWTWALHNARGSNTLFSISDAEFEVLLNEYMKINPFSIRTSHIHEPYPWQEYNVLSHIHLENGQPKYESSLMTLLGDALSEDRFTDIFGNYTDYLFYAPTNLRREMDILLMFGNPRAKNRICSYDIIEVKRFEFDQAALTQLIDYESWFLQKKVSGDLKMVRTTAIAKSFSAEVVDYVKKRGRFENKPIKLVEYHYRGHGSLDLLRIL